LSIYLQLESFSPKLKKFGSSIDPEQFADELEKIIDRWNEVVDNDLVQALFKFNKNSWFFLATYLFSRDYNEKSTREFVLSLIKFLYLRY
jgi:hypothetical protein